MNNESAATVGPIFTGGTGRSGTTIAGELLGRHPDLALIPVEMRFHVDGGGLLDLARGTVEVAEFEERLRTVWFHRKPNKSGPRGVHVVADESVLDAALEGLHDGWEADPWGACGQFMAALMQPRTDRLEARTWVEMTPPNGKQADALCRMFPGARVIHMIRDGRDVAASVARRSWGPNDIMSALTWWGGQVTQIDKSMRRAPAGQVRTIRLESLVVDRREDEYAELLDFCGLADAERMRRFFDVEVAAESMHPGRWRHGLDAEQQREVEERYAQVVARLEAKGVDAHQG